ncbi:hypothetical protein HPB50_005862 [Hyalomma asiaticum]|uniref:Uncharacterized protein n=1 Tax=Hyalomma asiaticum TaxID=266040 RepID=A0ACB7S568_HYAAI|nr:hypothetical protein HPB50_005862 [Hyalomma asiaticum]
MSVTVAAASCNRIASPLPRFLFPPCMMTSLALSFALVSLTTLSSAVTPPPALLLQVPSSTRRRLHPPHNASHVLPGDRGLQHRVRDRLFAEEGGNSSGSVIPLPSYRSPKSSRVVIGGDRNSLGGAVAIATDQPSRTARGADLHEFFRANQVVIYVACSCVLTGLVLVFTLVSAYGGRRRSHLGRSVSSPSWAQFAESYPLLDRSPLRVHQGSPAKHFLGSSDDEDDDENEAVAAKKNESVLDCTRAVNPEMGKRASSFAGYSPSEISEGPWSTTWSLPGEPPQVLIKSKPFVKRPIEVFPGRLLDLCNQDAPLTFLVLLPNGRQHRSKWIAHGRHSEVFRVTSLLRRTVLKVVPVSGDFTKQQIDTIESAIECCLKLSTLKHGMVYRAPNFIEVERIVCVFDQFPEWLLRTGSRDLDSSSESLAESLASEMAGTDGSLDASDLLAAFRRWKGTNQCCLTRHFIVFELYYAGKPLSRITLRSAVQGRSLVQQAACCVAVAECALGFRHTGVDADKLLVDVTDAASLEYRLPDRKPISVESAGLKAHLAGCLSFVIDSGGTGSGTPRFYGNVMWLGAVVDSVVNKLRSEVPASRARAERPVLEELLAWQARLQQCNSADEFVAMLGL